MFIRINNKSVQEQMVHMGVHPGGVELMAPKAQIIPLKILQVRSPAANIIKQEFLAIGGECATPAGAINCSVDRLDILLLGTTTLYRRLADKLLPMAQWFGLNVVINDLEEFLADIAPVTKLASGKVISYESMQVMGILNITPDSFFAGSRVNSEQALLAKAEQMLLEGASILDMGAESTRPGSVAVTEQEEQERITKGVAALRRAFPQSVISIDTYRSTTAQAALEAGADIINDITAGTADSKMLSVVGQYAAPLILMHMRGTPATMQQYNQYVDVVKEVTEYLLERAQAALKMGFTKEQLILDPGIGFAKTVEGNLALMKNICACTGHGMPVLLAASRKSTIGTVLGNVPAEERLEGTLATTAQAFFGGANLVRVHDVKEHVRLIKMLEAINK